MLLSSSSSSSSPSLMNKGWCVYISKQADNSLYTGVSNNLQRRRSYFRCRRGVHVDDGRLNDMRVVYCSASVYDYRTAVQMKYNLKRKCNKHFKLRLIKTDPLFLCEYLSANKATALL
ncbi:cyun73 [Cyclophragma undans nucleopolyhedrovirus]|uniref:Cyun73 n=1 Tax=Cyclophragma undans nucleopolyhedrovirus TaxID=1906244 RepID=A0A288QVT4_9ABAC|nr:cyun73 [Cyclophragma undans nucleopolyhedrovirus]AOT85469.1 cyun73 [Cyclophragma undans nucleopolyhedrovirus]